LDLRSRKVEVLDFEKLVGMSSLWEISFDCENDRARDDSRELLVDLHLRQTHTCSPQQKNEIMQNYLDRSMGLLAAASSDLAQEGSASKSLSLIQGLIEFLDRYEGKKPVKPELKQMAMQYSHLHPWPLTVTSRREGGQVESRINVSSFETLGAVRERCAKVFGLELNEFHMSMKSGFIDPDKDDDRYVKDHDMSLHIYLSPNQSYDKRAHPKFLVAANQEYFEQLFSLLSKNNAALTESVWSLL
jgi:hypothetical protein